MYLNTSIHFFRLPKFRRKIRPLLTCGNQYDSNDEAVITYQVTRGVKGTILQLKFFHQLHNFFFYQLAKLTLEEKCNRAVAVAKLNKPWNSDDNLKNAKRHNEEPGIKLKTCPKSRIKRRILMMEKTSYVVTRMKYQSSCYLDQKQRRWSL